MKILVLHNCYQLSGGEDAAVAQELSMLRSVGITVDLLELDNDAITNPWNRIRTAIEVSYSLRSRRLVADQIARVRPDVVHVHNFFPAFTPSVYDACRAAGVPVVQTLHNYRLVCPNALLFRDGKICTDCLSRALPLPAIRHGCYRGSHLGSMAVAIMIGIHRIRSTWARRVNRFIALTEFARDLFIEHAKIPPEQIIVKPNAAPDPGIGTGSGGYALFVGRLSEEKGIASLLNAARRDRGLDMPLKIAGTGPLEPIVAAAQIPGRIEYLGQEGSGEVRELMRQARLLIIPSLCFEGLPMVVPEAFGAGLPIVASRIGALETLIHHQHDGLLIQPGSSNDIVSAVRTLLSDATMEQRLRRGARKTYENLYQPSINVRLLLEIYEQALGGKSTV